jgi:hypothetical protein
VPRPASRRRGTREGGDRSEQFAPHELLFFLAVADSVLPRNEVERATGGVNGNARSALSRPPTRRSA